MAEQVPTASMGIPSRRSGNKKRRGGHRRSESYVSVPNVQQQQQPPASLAPVPEQQQYINAIPPPPAPAPHVVAHSTYEPGKTVLRPAAQIAEKLVQWSHDNPGATDKDFVRNNGQLIGALMKYLGEEYTELNIVQMLAPRTLEAKAKPSTTEVSIV